MKATKTEPGKLARKFDHPELTNLIAFKVKYIYKRYS